MFNAMRCKMDHTDENIILVWTRCTSISYKGCNLIFNMNSVVPDAGIKGGDK